MTEIVFDPAAHTYTVDGRVWPGVTQVLKDAGIIDTAHYTEEAATRGTVVHEAIYMMLRGVMPLASWEGSEAHAYLVAWERFVVESKISITGSEILCGEPTLQYATHIDLEGELNGRKVVIDVKTGSLQAWHGVQLAAFTTINDRRDRFILQLSNDGTYKLHAAWKKEQFSSRVWDKTWLSAITLYWWKRRVA